MKLRYRLINSCIVIALFTILMFSKRPFNVSSKYNNTGLNLSRTDKTNGTDLHTLKMPTMPPESSMYIDSINNSGMYTFPKQGIPVLMYHSISTVSGNSLCVPAEQLEDEMRWLHNRGYHTLSMDEFYEALTKKSLAAKKPILLTFDDGYIDNYGSAWPILRKYGFRACFFIVTDAVGSGAMNWNELADLVKSGNSIGSHTVHHLDLSRITLKEQENELIVSRHELEKNLGIHVKALCFPSGRYNDKTLKLMVKSGYELGFTTQPGKVHSGDDPLKLKRLRVPAGMTLSGFQEMFP